jgi:hypothetical protein
MGCGMSKHTPGPWGLDKDAHRHDPGFYGGEEGYHRINIPGVTDITGFCGDANAHLIKAAPDLYEALEELLAMRSKCFIPNEGDWWDNKARAALARAKGEQS